MNINKKIVIFCDGLDKFYSLKPIVEGLKKQNINPIIYNSNPDHKEIIKDYLGLKNENVIDLYKRFPIISRLLGRLSNLWIWLFVPSNFSRLYKLECEKKYLFQIPLFFLKKNINSSYVNFFKFITPKIFDNTKVLVFTTLNNTFWLSRSKQNIVVLDSWDHAYKKPFLFQSQKIFVWNEDLAKEVKEKQDCFNYQLIFPLRFRYIVELQDKYKINKKNINKFCDEIEIIKKNNFVTYVATYSSMAKKEFPMEKKLIKKIGNWCFKNQKKLYVKPKPFSNINDFKDLKNEPGLYIGISGENNLHMIDNEYHYYRKVLLESSMFIINLGTTFVLEAAFLKRPILQLHLEKWYEDIELFEGQNEHVEKYLYNNSDNKISVFHENPPLFFKNALKNQKYLMAYTKKLNKWIEPRRSLNQSLNLIITSLK